MALSIPPISVDAQTQQDCVRIVGLVNDLEDGAPQHIKNMWLNLWEQGENFTASQMQARIDFLASQPAEDKLSGATNLFTALCAKALRFINFIYNEDNTAFLDAVAESTGALQPNGQPYTKYFTVGWYYTLDATKPSGMAFISKCNWVQDASN